MEQEPDARSDAIDAVVVCRAEGRGEERPVAVRISGRRLAVVEILDDAVVGPVTAGGRMRRSVDVRLQHGQRLRLTRVLPEGGWQVWRVGGGE